MQDVTTEILLLLAPFFCHPADFQFYLIQDR